MADRSCSTLVVRCLSLAIACASLFMAGGCAPVAEHARPEVLPIIDAHGHLNADMSAEELVARMDASGVAAMVLMPRFYRGASDAGGASDALARQYAEKFPGRFVPFIGGQRGDLGQRQRAVWEGATPAGEAFLKTAREKLETGRFRGLGEFILRHYPYTVIGGQGGGDVDLPVDSYLMRRVAALAAEFGVPVLVHLEAEPEPAAAMERVLAAFPRTRFIWAHNCGRSSAAAIAARLERFPNLMCDLGGMAPATAGGYGRYWPRRTPWIHLVEDGTGTLDPDMKALFERFPDRFMLGTDIAHTPVLQWHTEIVHRFRIWLSQLSPPTARRIAHGNAREVFKLE
jgi:predicted TIM-barrel fold metal-dependent hydrolase